MPHYEFIQKEGDIVYIPEDYMHATVDLCRHTTGSVLHGDKLIPGAVLRSAVSAPKTEL